MSRATPATIAAFSAGGRERSVVARKWADPYWLVGISRRRRWSLTKQDAAAAPAPELLGRDFTAARPGTKLVGDITYVPTSEGRLYLATVIDLATREMIGHAMAEHMRVSLVVDAIEAAAKRHRLEPGCIFHDDRGSQCHVDRLPCRAGQV